MMVGNGRGDAVARPQENRLQRGSRMYMLRGGARTRYIASTGAPANQLSLKRSLENPLLGMQGIVSVSPHYRLCLTLA